MQQWSPALSPGLTMPPSFLKSNRLRVVRSTSRKLGSFFHSSRQSESSSPSHSRSASSSSLFSVADDSSSSLASDRTARAPHYGLLGDDVSISDGNNGGEDSSSSRESLWLPTERDMSRSNVTGPDKDANQGTLLKTGSHNSNDLIK